MVTLLGLLFATSAAFAVTEKLKLVKSPIYGTLVSTTFSPTCGCATDKATVSLKFRHRDAVTITVLTAGRKPVRTLVAAVPVSPGRTVFRWDGRTDPGELAPDGTYRVEVHLVAGHRTILLPNEIELDTRAPTVRAVPNRRVFSPDGDHQADFVTVHFTVSEPAHVLLYLGRRLLVRSRSHTAKGAVTWSGRVGGHVLPAGPATLTVGAVDLAGNATPVAKRARLRITIRYITLARSRVTVAAGRPFEIGVSTDARRYAWRLGSRRGTARGHVLRLRAPTQRGRYTLVVTEHGHSDRAAVIVR
jgi:hypothetical protein